MIGYEKYRVHVNRTAFLHSKTLWQHDLGSFSYLIFFIKVIFKEPKNGNRHQFSQFNGAQWGKLTKNGAPRETQISMGQTLKLRGCPVENGTSGHPT